MRVWRVGIAASVTLLSYTTRVYHHEPHTVLDGASHELLEALGNVHHARTTPIDSSRPSMRTGSSDPAPSYTTDVASVSPTR